MTMQMRNTGVCVKPRCFVTADIDEEIALVEKLAVESMDCGWSMSGSNEPMAAMLTAKSAAGIEI